LWVLMRSYVGANLLRNAHCTCQIRIGSYLFMYYLLLQVLWHVQIMDAFIFLQIISLFHVVFSSCGYWMLRSNLQFNSIIAKIKTQFNVCLIVSQYFNKLKKMSIKHDDLKIGWMLNITLFSKTNYLFWTKTKINTFLIPFFPFCYIIFGQVITFLQIWLKLFYGHIFEAFAFSFPWVVAY
jgi:hypothetical protein